LFFYLYKKQMRGEVKASEVWEVEAWMTFRSHYIKYYRQMTK
jgi:hypothetical protein